MGRNQPKVDAFQFAERLHKALDRIPDAPSRARGRPAWLSKLFSVNPVTSRAWVLGEYMPSSERVRKLARMAGVSYEWLYFGTGPMLVEAASQTEREEVVMPSQRVRDETLTIALRLAAEAIGRDLYLPPQEHTALVLMVMDLVEEGLPEARVVDIARRQAAVLATRGNDDTQGEAGAGGQAARRHR